MEKIEEKVCFWYGMSRKKERMSAFEKQGCYECRGKNEDCNKYIEVTNTYPMRQNTSPYEEGHAGYKKRKK